MIMLLYGMHAQDKSLFNRPRIRTSDTWAPDIYLRRNDNLCKFRVIRGNAALGRTRKTVIDLTKYHYEYNYAKFGRATWI